MSHSFSLTAQSQTLLYGLGLLLHVPGVMALVSVLVCLIVGEPWAVATFLLTAGFALASGQILYRLFRPAAETDLRSAMLIAALGWGCVSAIGAIPFLLISAHPAAVGADVATVRAFQDPWNALFESFSGFTSTGLSVALRPQNLPASLQWWRSFSEWVGGVGVIVLMLSVIRSVPGLYRLYYSEARSEKLFPSVASTVRTIWWIYLLYTVLAVLLLRGAGMPWWDAVNHGMTGISTGGFAITSNSMAAYDEQVQLALIPVMVFGAISFMVHYRVLTERNPLVFWRDTQHRLLAGWLVGGALLLIGEQIWFTDTLEWIDPLFAWVSAVTTCGFSTANLRLWSPTAKLLLTLAMLFGGAAGSTVGGIKLSRVHLLFKGIQWRFETMSLRPHQLQRYSISGEVVDEKEAIGRVEATAVMLALWLIVMVCSVIVLQHIAAPTYSSGEILFEVTSALSNVGLSVGITNPELAWPGKLTLMLCMWMGRLEIVPVALIVARLLVRD